MKKLFFLVLLFANFFGYAQYTLIPDADFEKALINLGIDNGTTDEKVLTTNISGVKELDISNKNISDLTGIEAFVGLSTLICTNNKLTSLDITKNKALLSLSCSDNKLSNLDVSENSALTQLNCSKNQLTNLDITKNTNLLILECVQNKLSKIDVTKNIKLNTLQCSTNQLTDLDINENLELKSLNCNFNQLTNLEVTRNIALTELICNVNQIKSLDIKNNIYLKDLDVSSNQLVTLDVSKNSDLVVLACGANQLSSVDLSKNLKLRTLSIFNNKITEIDLANNTNLTAINCNSNLISKFNIRNGNNAKILFINLVDNPSLKCIQVDNKTYSDTNWSNGEKDATAFYSEDCSKTKNVINPPVITATGTQTYCPGTSLKIVETISITSDPTEPATDALYIQISSGYIASQDILTLSNPAAHPKIITSWDPVAGKLKLSSPIGAKIPYTDFEAAIKDILYSNSSPTPSGTRNFSITIGQANFLPSTGHYYEFVPSIGITWTSARTAAEALNYYGLKGYLATISSLEEVQISGEQAKGAGWIGGSDAATEGVWKWVTGPEGLANGGTGITFWNGLANGSTPNFAYWNTNEPNQFNGANEDYAHITAPGVGITGSWNDLTITGEPTGNYQPKGYIVEYGGMPGDPILKISASTKITIPAIFVTTTGQGCGTSSITLRSVSTLGIVNWYDSAVGGNLLHIGNEYTPPPVSKTTNYYVDAANGNCPNLPRVQMTIYIYAKPTITAVARRYSRCGEGTVTLSAAASDGIINWYNAPVDGSLLGTGTSFTTPNISSTTTYYAEAVDAICISDLRVPIEVVVYTPPIVLNQEITKCKSSSLELDASLSGMLYLWSTGEKTQKITVSTPGIYSVIVTSPAPENCSSTKKITVQEYNIPEIDRIDVNETTVVIYVKQEELYYEYSVDGINYQSSNEFFNVPSGLQTAYVREINFCSTDSEPFIVLMVPKFFTPNGDSYNDVWEIKGISKYPQAEVRLFDRYGKYITTLNAINKSWNGNYNGAPLPADDYWYILNLGSGKPEIKGHFSLKR